MATEEFPKSEEQMSKSLFDELEKEVKRTGLILEDALRRKEKARAKYNLVVRGYYDAKNNYRQALREFLNAKTRTDPFGLKSA